MKNNFKSRFSKERLAKFFDKEGFYIVLFLCVCIVAVTAVWVSRTGVKNDEKQNLGDTNENQTVVDTPSKQTSSSNDEKPKISAVDDAKASTPQTGNTASTQNSASNTNTKTAAVQANFKLGSPIKDGVTDENIAREYSPTDLVCFQYLNEWRAHGGIDIKANEGTEVVAGSDGKVIDAFNDTQNGLGWTVIVDHNNGYRTVYANLGETVAVSKNATVKKGQKLGVVGNTTTYEQLSFNLTPGGEQAVSHLHFEVLKKVAGKYEFDDPNKYLTMQK